MLPFIDQNIGNDGRFRRFWGAACCMILRFQFLELFPTCWVSEHRLKFLFPLLERFGAGSLHFRSTQVRTKPTTAKVLPASIKFGMACRRGQAGSARRFTCGGEFWLASGVFSGLPYVCPYFSSSEQQSFISEAAMTRQFEIHRRTPSYFQRAKVASSPAPTGGSEILRPCFASGSGRFYYTRGSSRGTDQRETARLPSGKNGNA